MQYFICHFGIFIHVNAPPVSCTQPLMGACGTSMKMFTHLDARMLHAMSVQLAPMGHCSHALIIPCFRALMLHFHAIHVDARMMHAICPHVLLIPKLP